MNSLISHKKFYFAKQLVFIFILVASSFSTYAQNGMERKQLFDYDWKFFLGDASEAENPIVQTNYTADPAPMVSKLKIQNNVYYIK